MSTESGPDRVLTELAETLDAIAERLRDEVLWNGSVWQRDTLPLEGQGRSLIRAAQAELANAEQELLSFEYLRALDRKGL